MNSGAPSNRLVCVVALLLLALWAHSAQSQNSSNIDPVERWAWGTNAGWLNLRPADGGVEVYEFHLRGWAWGENIGWVHFGTHTGPDRHTYSNTSPDDYGVNHDGAGNLSGYAWSSNVGWINFAPSHGGVTVDLATGSFDGYAWAENVGWISFRGTGTMHTIDEIMVAAPAADDTNGALPSEVVTGRTYWGLRTNGTWGPQTGNLDPCTTDSDGDTIPNCYDQCLADPAKVFPGTCGCGVADVGDQDGDGLLDCEDPCPLPGQDLWIGDLCLSNGTCTEVYFADDPDGDGCTNSKSMSPTTGCDCDTPACF